MTVAALRIRLADPDADATAVAAIYRPAVERTIASFEQVAPEPAAMAARMRGTLERHPWLVAEVEDAVVAYAYASPHHARQGYRWSVNISVYVDVAWHGRGVGRALYEALLAILRRQRLVNVYAGVALPNPASVRLHESIGMRPVAAYPRVGYKFGAWHDVLWFGMRLAEPGDPPPEPISLPDLEPRP